MADERILIVEDESITGESIRQMVEEFGYHAIGPIASGKDAIASAMAHHPDLILMDILLKGPINGIQAAETIRSHSRCPIIYITANSDRLKTESVKATEPFGSVLKPIDKQELQRAIETALNLRRSVVVSGEWPPSNHDTIG